MTYCRYKGASQEAFRNSHKRDLVGEPPGTGARRFRKASCEATGIFLTKHAILHSCIRISGRNAALCAAQTVVTPLFSPNTPNSSEVSVGIFYRSQTQIGYTFEAVQLDPLPLWIFFSIFLRSPWVCCC